MLATFIESPCRFQGDTVVSNITWSSMDQLAALATNTMDENDKEINQVLFMSSEGTVIPDSAITHNAAVTVFEWQPKGRLLAIGWADGMVSCWIVDGRNRPTSSYSNQSQHNSAITMIKWNPVGKRLITGDQKGQICVWTVDARGTLSPTRQYRKKAAITSAVFCVVPIKLEIKRKSGEIKQTYSPAFFFGTEKGLLAFADDLGHCTDVQQLSSSVDIMMFFEERSRLVVITRSLMLTQYQVAEDGKVSRVMQMKLSVAGDLKDMSEKERGLRHVVWASPGLLAAATHEKMLRLFDIAADETYTLSLSTLGDIVDRSDKIISVAFGPLDRYLAIGTQGGIVAVWRFNGPIRDVSLGRTTVVPTASNDWELQYKTTLAAPVVQLTWHWGQGTLAALIDDRVSVSRVVVLSESVMQAGMCGDISIVQCSNTNVSMHITGVSEAWVEDTSIVVKGLSVAQSCFVVWSGKMARVYRVDGQLRSIEPIEPFLCTGHSMVIADATHIVEEALFIAENSSVRIVNFAGTQKATISFTEAEGLPMHIHMNGKFLAVVTNIGIIKILDCHAPTKPKLLGSAGRIYDPLTGMGIGATTQPPINANAAASSSNGPSSSSKGQQGETDATVNGYLAIRSIKLNCDGTRVAVITDFVEGALQVRHPDSKLLVFDRNKGGVSCYDFEPVKRCPISAFWDDTDDRILVCEARRSRSQVSRAAVTVGAAGAEAGASATSSESKDGGGSNGQSGGSSAAGTTASDSESESEVDVVIFFATTEDGLLLQDSFGRKYPLGSLLGIMVPRLYFRSSPAISNEEPVPQPGAAQKLKIHSKIMRDFVGMTDIDMNPAAKLALLDFSYNLTLGKLDEAYRAIKTIDNPSVWENMAQMCIKTKRLDVAEVCLGHMGHARGAAALRESRKDGHVDVSVGVLAIQLGLNDEAARLFREAGRFDMLNKLLQCSGSWSKAINVATNNDRIHLKTTHYNYARYLESIGELDAAIKHYELSDNSRTEVPRMLFDNGKLDDLEDYVHKSEDKLLLKWWGAYLESTERYEKACKYYRKSGDFLSLVRVACFKEDFAQASEIVQECGDRAAAYHFARQLELRGDYQAAIDYFAEAGCYNHSIRLARAYGLDGELMRFAMKSTQSLMLDCATYFEGKGEFDKAVQLYHKGGDLPKALDLIFRAGEANPGSKTKGGGVFDMLNAVAQDLGAETSPQTLARCAEFLVLHKQFQRAVELYVMAKRYNQAIEMCIQHRVQIDDEMSAQLTPPDTMDAAERKEVLCDLGKALKKQGSFSLASKKYTLAGDRVRAIKCLVRSGDTAAVIKFATISRNAEIYTLAANYLQQMNWRESVDIMKAIINFYTKANAFEQLASFYDSCAQVEIDEYRDYEKATGALREALKYLGRANSRSAADMTEMIEKRLVLIEKFIQARKSMKRDPDTMVSICESLLQDPMLEEAIRAGDCLAMLIEYFHGRGQMRDAYNYIQEMEDRKIALNPYVEAEVLNDVYKAVGKQPGGNRDKSGPKAGSGGAEIATFGNGDEDDDVVEEEEVEEEVEEEDEDERKAPSPKRNGGRGGPPPGRGYAQQNTRK